MDPGPFTYLEEGDVPNNTLVSCGETDWGCAEDEWLAALDPALKEKAEILAWDTLRSLTAYRLGNCPVTVRPCSRGCWQQSSYEVRPVVGSPPNQNWGSGLLAPRVVDGQWLNTPCGCGTECSCEYLPIVELVGPVGQVVAVSIDGTPLPSTAWRIDNGYQLVRLDGQAWPACQNMAADIDKPGTFAVSYIQGFAPDNLAAWSAGLLAVEFAKACKGEKCVLPRGVQSISRQGIGLTINQDMFEGGSTGITVVDAYVRLLNPNHLKQGPRIYSPDRTAPRQTTWQRATP
jgi:hypothetical protein